MKKLFIILLFIFSLSFLAGQEQIQLRWEPSTDNVGVTGYNVWIDAEYYGTTSDTSIILSLDPGLYALAVSAFDAAGNESELSISLMVNIGDNTAPSIPYDLMLVYPNPTYGNFTVKFKRDLKMNSVLQVLSTSGQLIYERVLPSVEENYEESFDLRELLNGGMYILALIEDNERVGHTYLSITDKSKTASL